MPIDLITLAQAGPAVLLLLGIIRLYTSFIAGDVIPGHIFRAEQAQRAKAEAQAERNAESIAANTAIVRQILDVLLRDAGR